MDETGTHPVVASAGRLASALVFNADPDFRLALLKRVARRLGEAEGYPTFLKLLVTIAESEEPAAHRALAATLAIGLRRNDLPSGQLTAWGASRMWQAGTPISGALAGQMFGSSAPQRSFGPIEYLTVWYAQGTQRTRLGEEVYAHALARLVSLVNADEEARTLYPLKLEADMQTELEGIYMRGTRERLSTFAAHWKSDPTPHAVAAAAVAAGGEPRQVPRGWLIRDL
jgi:hypothetical protein